MRWDNLTVEEEQRAALAGYREPAVVRHFDAPEALDMTFYEVRAKSALNRVPEQSQVPFRWTVNPYRGCSHACSYCTSGDAPILMADGRHKPMRDVRPGDRIYGTERRGRYRHFVITEVLDHWQVVRQGYRTVLDDGTELVTSSDHRFLSGRGWRYVTNTHRGAPDRPHLTLGTELLGLARVVESPLPSRAYRRGYLCGLARGDGRLHSDRAGGGGGEFQRHQFRLALADLEALRRAREFLEREEAPTTEVAFAAGTDVRRPMRAIRAQSRGVVERIRNVVGWPLDPSDEWLKGFLAGIFDAEGSCSNGVFRIANTDGVLLGWTMHAMKRFRFDVVLERVASSASGVHNVRLRGGVAEQQRFFQLTDPAITRKRSIEGRALETSAQRVVLDVEPLAMKLPLYDMSTGTGDFIADGVVSHNCFARPTHKYLDMDAGRDFERRIVVKVNVPEVLRAELRRPSWKGEHVAMGTNTDPYQWVEGRYRLMPGIWEALRDARNPCSVLTKSPLVLRDLELLKDIAAVTEVSANLSVPTIDEKAWRASEPHTPNPRARLEAVGELNRAGIPSGILIAPLMPGINDDPRQVEEILRLASEAGATSIGGITLHLRGEVREIFMDWLRSYRPDLVPRYEELYARGAYAPMAERERVEGVLRRARRAAGLPVRTESMRIRRATRLARDPAPPVRDGGASRAPAGNGSPDGARPAGQGEAPAQARLF
jgi:DNA repair photolyase